MTRNVSSPIELRTFGHATLVVSVDGKPCLATDPWLLGSTYWRSWWLERYPSQDEIDLVRESPFIYLTHSHPDHFHWPSLRMLGPKVTLHPAFPSYSLPGFLSDNGYPAYTLKPWQRYQLTEDVRITSVPVLIDDSILLIESPGSLVVNLNDGKPPTSLLKAIRREFASDKDKVFALCSYSPASSAAVIYRDGKRVEAKSKTAYVRKAFEFADALGATHYVPFASQAVFRRSDSRWANQLKVTFEDLQTDWPTDSVQLCSPYTVIDLRQPANPRPTRQLPLLLDPGPEDGAKISEREAEERAFILPADFDERLVAYLHEVWPLRLLYPRGIGWRLSTSGTERFYNTKRRALEEQIPDEWDVIVTLPDKVLYECLRNGILTDLGITMFIRVDTRTDYRRTRVLFIILGLRDYKHLAFPDLCRFVTFYGSMMIPGKRKTKVSSVPLQLPARAELVARKAS